MLDTHLSPALAELLRGHGVDAVAASEDPDLRSATDEELLREASRQRRALVTFNVRDYVALARRWAFEERSHAGILLLHARSIRQDDIGTQLRALLHLVQDPRLSGDDFLHDLVLYVLPPPSG